MFPCPKTKVSAVYKFFTGGLISDFLVHGDGRLLTTCYDSAEVLEVVPDTKQQSTSIEVRPFLTIPNTRGLCAIARSHKPNVFVVAGVAKGSGASANNIHLWTLSIDPESPSDPKVLPTSISIPTDKPTNRVTLLPLKTENGDILVICNSTATIYRIDPLSQSYVLLDGTSSAMKSLAESGPLQFSLYGSHIYAIGPNSKFLHRLAINPGTGMSTAAVQKFHRIAERGYAANAIAFDARGLAWILLWGGEEGDWTVVVNPGTNMSRSFAGLFGWDLFLAGGAMLRFAPGEHTACIIEDGAAANLEATLYTVQFFDKSDKKHEDQASSSGLGLLKKLVKRK